MRAFYECAYWQRGSNAMTMYEKWFLRERKEELTELTFSQSSAFFYPSATIHAQSLLSALFCVFSNENIEYQSTQQEKDCRFKIFAIKQFKP